MRIPFADVRAQTLELSTELTEAFERVAGTGTFVLGGEVAAFERRVADRLGVRHAIGVSSGTDALLVTLTALGVHPGDEVITTPMSFIATAESIRRVGATVRFVDIEPKSLNLDAARIEDAVTPRTRVILPVHLYGRPARSDTMSEVAARRGLFLVEDAAQAFGSKLGACSAGAWGTAGCFSFFPTKLLGAAGDAGLVVTEDDTLAARLRRLRQHGSDDKNRYTELGGNFRIDAIQAAILSAKLSHVERWISLRRAHAHAYDEAFRCVPGIELIEEEPGIFWNGGIYSIRVLDGRRDALRGHLKKSGIETRVYYDPPLHLQPALLCSSIERGSLPEAERAARQVLSLPLYPELSTVQREDVIEAVLEFMAT